MRPGEGGTEAALPHVSTTSNCRSKPNPEGSLATERTPEGRLWAKTYL